MRFFLCFTVFLLHFTVFLPSVRASGIEDSSLPSVSLTCVGESCEDGVYYHYTQQEDSVRVGVPLSKDSRAAWSCSENCNVNIPKLEKIHRIHNIVDSEVGIIGHTVVRGVVLAHNPGEALYITPCNGQVLSDLTGEANTFEFVFYAQNSGPYCIESQGNVYGVFQWPSVGGETEPEDKYIANLIYFPFLPNKMALENPCVYPGRCTP